MKSKPSDYQKGFRYIKKEKLPPKGAVFAISDIEEVDKSDKAGQHYWCIRLTFEERWWLELRGGNLDAAIEILGDDFSAWSGAKLGLCLSTFTTQDGEEKSYIKIVPAPAITLRQRPERGKAKAPLPERLNEIPF
jgi:hypothetical protein